ncbi:hypothetical protein Tco_0885490 [Tanacetum coccineum]
MSIALYFDPKKNDIRHEGAISTIEKLYKRRVSDYLHAADQRIRLDLREKVLSGKQRRSPIWMHSKNCFYMRLGISYLTTILNRSKNGVGSATFMLRVQCPLTSKSDSSTFNFRSLKECEGSASCEGPASCYHQLVYWLLNRSKQAMIVLFLLYVIFVNTLRTSLPNFGDLNYA